MKYLIALQDTDSSAHAFSFLLSVIKPDDEAYLLAVAEEAPMYASGPYVNMDQMVAINLGLQEYMKAVVRAYGKELSDRNIKHVCLLGKGESAKVSICDEAEFYGVDLIIVGRRNMPGIQRTITSSTSSYVVHNAPCAVIVVKDEWKPDPNTVVPPVVTSKPGRKPAEVIQ